MNKKRWLMLFVGMILILGVGGNLVSSQQILVINNCSELQNIRNNLNGNYVLGGNISCSGITNFIPIGNSTTPFKGTLDGKGFTISNLSISRTTTNYVGLFGIIVNGGEIKNLRVYVENIVGRENVGGLAGYNLGKISNCGVLLNSGKEIFGRDNNVGGLVGSNDGNIEYSYVKGEGKIKFARGVDSLKSNGGGLVGLNNGSIKYCYTDIEIYTGSYRNSLGGLVGDNRGDIINSYSKGYVKGGGSSDHNKGSHYVGGLVGWNRDTGKIKQSYSMGRTQGLNYVGGLVGFNNGEIEESFSKNSYEISGKYYYGGLVGFNLAGTIKKSFSNNTVKSNSDGSNSDGKSYGVLVGINEGVISDSYSEGYVGTAKQIGGLVGFNRKEGTILKCYSIAETGALLKEDGTFWFDVGSLVGKAEYITKITDSFFNKEINVTKEKSQGGTGKLPYQMKEIATFSGVGWSISSISNWNNHVWFIDSGNDYPRLWYERCPGFMGGIGTPNKPCEITSWRELQSINEKPSAQLHYKLMDDLDNNSPGYDAYASKNANGGEGWLPIGTSTSSYFNGSFNGNGKIISDLYINRPATDYQGLFGYVDGGEISNVGVINCNITGKDYVGGLVGLMISGLVKNSYSHGKINGNEKVGGLIGVNMEKVENSYSIANVFGKWHVGGLAGINSGTTSNCYALGNLSGTGSVGGLIGWSSSGTVSNCYASGIVIGTNSGGLIGSKTGTGTVTNSFYDNQTSGRNDNDGRGVPKTTAEMKNFWTFRNLSVWSIAISNINKNNGYPFLGWEDNNATFTWLIYSDPAGVPPEQSTDPNDEPTRTTYWRCTNTGKICQRIEKREGQPAPAGVDCATNGAGNNSKCETNYEIKYNTCNGTGTCVSLGIASGTAPNNECLNAGGLDNRCCVDYTNIDSCWAKFPNQNCTWTPLVNATGHNVTTYGQGGRCCRETFVWNSKAGDDGKGACVGTYSKCNLPFKLPATEFENLFTAQGPLRKSPPGYCAQILKGLTEGNWQPIIVYPPE